ncbi:LPS-assembly protein LptD [Thalassotalea fusca]
MPFSSQHLILLLCSALPWSVLGQSTNVNDTVETTSSADNTLVCPVPVHPTITPERALNSKQDYRIYSNTADAIKNEIANFTGEVKLFGKDRTITADSLMVNRVTSEISADGNIHFQNKGINIFASQLSASKASKSTQLLDSSYQLNHNPGHGSASEIFVSADGVISLRQSSFTTCYGEVPDWQMLASEINISVEENHGEAYNARFELFGMPILYVPYFSFPVTNERKSGVLYPTISSSGKSGLEIEVPYYWNIAENMDATITPRLMSKRGLQLNTEFRYLSGEQSGELNIEYLNEDKELVSNNDPRYLVRLEHTGTFSENFRAHVDYTTISDDNYLIDLDSSQYNTNDTYLYQIGELAYFGEDWQASIKAQDFEVLGDHQSSYKTVPHIELAKFIDIPFANGQFDIYSELTQFKTDDLSQPEANRYHVEAGAIFPISTPAWFLTSEFRLLQTNYEQERIAPMSSLEEDVSRTLPKIRLHGGINFDRDMSNWKSGYTQTLEPQLQYLYIPNKDQSNIGLYDTTSLQDDFAGLFRDRRFSGLDRIAEANQYSWGITTRILDENNSERFRLSLGRIVYVDDINDVQSASDSALADESVLASEVAFRLSRNWQFSSDIQYNTKNNNTNRSQSTLDYQFENNQSIQLNHRYSEDVSGTTLEQASILGNIAINENWQLVARVTEDLQEKRNLESYLGLQYESCCWAVRVAYHRHISSNLDDQTSSIEKRDEFDSGFMLEFVFKGLNGNMSSISTQDMFNDSIFGYKRPYYLNN